MSVIDELITDRTLADVETALLYRSKWLANTITAAEKREWAQGMKGAWNPSDSNRVGQAIVYIENRFTAAGYDLGTAYSPPTSSEVYVWAETQLEDMRKEIVKLRALVPVPSDTPAVPSTLAKIDYSKANNIEKILKVVDGLMDNISAAYIHSGTTYSGFINGVRR